MTRLVELQKRQNEIKNQITALKNEGKIDEAHKMLAELENVKKEIEIEAVTQANDTTNYTKVNTISNVKPMQVFNKLLKGQNVSEEEMAVYKNAVGTPGQVEHTAEKGGVLVPEEQVNEILDYKRGLSPLKEIVDVISVNTLSGRIPVAAEASGELIAFDELNDINQSDLDFTQLKYEIADYADIIPVSNTLLDDETAGLISFIKGRFAKKAVATENTKIATLIKGATLTQAGTDWTAISTALNTGLDVALRTGAMILCSQSSFDYLDTLVDGNGRPLLTPDLTNPARLMFKGLPVKVVNDTLLPNTGKKLDFYVGNFKEYIKFFDRKGIEIAISTEAGFTKNATLLRAIERFDVQVADTKAIIKVTITPATGA